MRRSLAVPLLALALLAGCGGDDGDAPEPTEAGAPPGPADPSGPVAVAVTPLEVTLVEPGGEPRQPLVQDFSDTESYVGLLTFSVGVEGVTSAEIEGDSTLDVTDVDDQGSATVAYGLRGLDVALAAGDAEPGEPVQDALDITGEMVVGPDRGVTSATVATTSTSDALPGVEGVAGSLDPRLTAVLFPFPTEPVGVGGTWTVRGPLPLFGAQTDLVLQAELVERRGGRFTFTVALTFTTPDPGTGPDVSLRGFGRVIADSRELGVRRGSIGLAGTVVLPDRGPDPLPMALDLSIRAN